MDKTNLLLLFERPQEPVFMEKGKFHNVFDVPDSYLTDRYRPIGGEVQTRFGDEAGPKISVRQISIPDMRIPLSLGRNEPFSLWIPRHRKIAGRLVDIFMGEFSRFFCFLVKKIALFPGMRSVEDLLSCAVYARDRLNPLLFNYAMSVAMIHRPDTKDLNLPSFVESFPDKFVDSKVLSQIREEATIVPQGSRNPIIIPKDYTASNLEEEHKYKTYSFNMFILSSFLVLGSGTSARISASTSTIGIGISCTHLRPAIERLSPKIDAASCSTTCTSRLLRATILSGLATGCHALNG
jgi:tyrosinase